MEKSDFLKILENLSPQEINKLIEEKGKKPKLIYPFIRIKKQTN